MYLSDRDIVRRLTLEEIVITPLPAPEAMGPCSIDLRLGKTFVDPDTKECFQAPFVLQPGEFMLGEVIERIKLPSDLAGHLEGRSSWGRKGLVIHSTSGLVQPGWGGVLTLELRNNSKRPINLLYGVRICTLCFVVLSSSAQIPYGGPSSSAKYQNQGGVTGSRISEEL